MDFTLLFDYEFKIRKQDSLLLINNQQNKYFI